MVNCPRFGSGKKLTDAHTDNHAGLSLQVGDVGTVPVCLSNVKKSSPSQHRPTTLDFIEANEDKSISVSRRQFMKILAGATAAAAGIGVPAILYLAQDDDEDNTHQSSTPSPNPTPQNDIGLIIPTLMAATEALFIAYDIEPSHYEAYFRYRSVTLDGYAGLYQQFVTTLDTAAQNNGQASFVESDRAAQRGILDRGLQHIINNDFQDSSADITTDAATWEHFARFFLREVLGLFMYTDAWIAVGYDGWPGMARGLERYRQALTPSDSRILG